MLDYKVVFSSRTGNTEMLAKAVYEALPGSSKDIERISEATGAGQAEVYLIGFWVDRGSCSIDVLDFLEELDGKEVILFGTCGSRPDTDYLKMIENNVRAFIPDGNTFLGLFLSQGKMPMDIRRKYEGMSNTKELKEQMDKMLHNFDEALLHPDAKDRSEIQHFVRNIIEKRV